MVMAKKATPRARRNIKQMLPGGGGDGLLDVTVVLLEEGYASTAIAPVEIFHSAGVVWNWLYGEAVQPRFRVPHRSMGGK